MTHASLEDALASGSGVERPFRCPVHGDTNASASVNVVKGVWYCYACKATGTVDGKKAPSAADLAAMLGKDDQARVHPESWLDLFWNTDYGSNYWSSRLPVWVSRMMMMGTDPFTGEATFPVDTDGKLLGVGRRRTVDGEGPRYRYPAGWAASRSMFGFTDHRRKGFANLEVASCLVLVEGAADACAMYEVGARALACYGSGVHAPQLELINRIAPKLVLIAFDNDAAGQRAADYTGAQLQNLCRTDRVRWPDGGDPASVDPERRTHELIESVVRLRHAAGKALVEGWTQTAAGWRTTHTPEEY